MSVLKNTEAIVLRKRDVRETSSLVSFYTRSQGKVLGMLKGVRGPRGQTAADPQLMTVYEIVYYPRRRKDVCVVSQCDMKDFFPKIRGNFERISYGLYFLELVDVLTGVMEENPGLYEVLFSSLRLLETPMSFKRTARIFEIKFLDAIGLGPVFDHCVECGTRQGTRYLFSPARGGVLCLRCQGMGARTLAISNGTINFLEHIRKSAFDSVVRIKVSDEVGREVETLLVDFIEYHLGKRLRTREFITRLAL